MYVESCVFPTEGDGINIPRHLGNNPLFEIVVTVVGIAHY